MQESHRKLGDQYCSGGTPSRPYRNSAVLTHVQSMIHVGIFTERELLNKLAGKSASSPDAAVRDLMSADAETLDETDLVAAAPNTMPMGRYRHFPVRKVEGSYSVTSIRPVIKYLAKAE
jgi:signal-transduction protein with cAMP-binding, CBS, and nucleotidyltransferase domain